MTCSHKLLEFKLLPAINQTQKSIIEGTLQFIFDEIAALKPLDALFVLNSILLYDSKHQLLVRHCIRVQKKLGLRESIKSITDMLVHPCPQNRYVGDASATGDYLKYPDGVKDGIVYYWKNGFGSEVASEPQGLLGLTARDDVTSHLITADATKKAILDLIKNEIIKQQTRAQAKDDFVLSSKLLRFDITTLFGDRNLSEWISRENKDYLVWIKEDKTQTDYSFKLYLQLVFGLILYLEDAKKIPYKPDVEKDKHLDAIIHLITKLHEHLRNQNRVDYNFSFSLKFSDFLFAQTYMAIDVLTTLNTLLEGMKRAYYKQIPLYIRDENVHFNFTLREIGLHAVENLRDWREGLTPKRITMESSSSSSGMWSRPSGENKESKEEKKLVFAIAPPGGPSV